jgi:sugar lactone lactonase YvrE
MLDAVHPSWSLEEIRPPGFEPQVGGMAFLPDGRLVLSSFEPVNNGVFREEPNGTIWALDHVIGGRPETISAEMIADGFHDPAGLCVVDGDIYVAHRNDITRLRDTDDDGTFETREVFASGWVSDNYHHFTFGLVEHRGSLYGSLSTSIYFGNTIKNDNVEGEVVSMNGPNPEHRGTVFRVALETGEIEYLAGGFRTPNGLGVGTGGRIFVADNQGAWLPASKFVAVKPGRFYGHYNGAEGQTSDSYPEGGSPALHSDQPVSPPTVWLPQNECANSPTESMLIREGPFIGQMYLAELTTGGIRRIFLEEVDGDLQGVVFRSCQGFEAGINRMVMGPDGCLYVGCTGASGNWSWRDKRFGLQRLRPTGKTTLEYESVAVRPEGFYVTFTRAVDTEWLSDPANYSVTQWHYEPTPQYGGPKHDTRRLAVSKAAPAGDGTAVTLTIPELRAGSVVHLRCDPTALDGEPMWATEAWYTLNAIPRQQTRTMRHAFRLLDRDDMRTFREPLGDWTLADGVASNGESGRTRHLVSQFEHGDVAAHIEFMIPEGSNSGVYFMGRYEIQVFDSHGVETPQHSDCGGIYQRWDPGRGSGHEGYEGVPPLVNAARPAGRWQTFDVRFRAPRFDEDGNKIRNAVFEEVVHNGRIIHEDVELTGPTRAAMFRDEKAFGPLMLQGDHGPVSYRRIRLIPLRAPSRPAGTGETSPSRR